MGSTECTTPSPVMTWSPPAFDEEDDASTACAQTSEGDESAGPYDMMMSAYIRRNEEAAREVARILALERTSFVSLVDWGFAVLGAAQHNEASVARGYRALMRSLHPDKAEQSSLVVQAAQSVREAKDLCERSLSTQGPPGPPQRLGVETLCAWPGRRRYRLHWEAPEKQSSVPVHRYIVAVLDTSLGKALPVARLEPDYSEELRRFVPVEELLGYELAEEELKIAGLFP